MNGKVQDNRSTSHTLHVRKDSRSGIENSRDSIDPGREIDVPSPVGESRGITNNTSALSALAEYSELIATRSALLTQHTQLKEKSGRIKSRNDRWQKHYGSFATLAEDYDRELRSVTSEIALIEMKIRQNGSDQDKVAHTLMLALMENITPIAPKIEAEIESCKASMRDNRFSLMDLKEEVKGLHKPSKHDDMEQQFRLILGGYDKRMEGMTDQLNKIRLRAEGHEKVLSHVRDIQARVVRFDDFESAAADTLMDNAKEIEAQKKLATESTREVDSLKKKLESLIEDFHTERLNQSLGDMNKERKKLNDSAQENKIERKKLTDSTRDIEAEKKKLNDSAQEFEIEKKKWNDRMRDMELEKKRLNDTIQDVEAQRKKMEELVQGIQLKLEETARDSEIQKKRVETLAAEVLAAKMNSRPETPQPSQVDLRPRMDALEQESKRQVRSIAEHWHQALRNFEEQQQIKDDELSKELGRIDDSLLLLEHAANEQAIREQAAREQADREQAARAQAACEQSASEPDAVNAEPPSINPPSMQNVDQQVQTDKELQAEDLIWSKVGQLEAALNQFMASYAIQKDGTESRVDESLRAKVQQLEFNLVQFMTNSKNRTDGMEVMFQSQQQRFDNLSTETFAKHMINYMRLIYPPHPANVAEMMRSSEMMRTSINALSEQRNSMIATINANAQRCQAVSERFPALSKQVDSLQKVTEDLGRKIAEGAKTVGDDFDQKIRESDVVSFQRFAELKQASGERFKVLDGKWAEMKQESSSQLTEMQGFVNLSEGRLAKVESSTTKEIAALQTTVVANEARLDKVEAKQYDVLASLEKLSSVSSTSEPQIKIRDSDEYSCSSDSDPPISNTPMRRSNRSNGGSSRRWIRSLRIAACSRSCTTLIYEVVAEGLLHHTQWCLSGRKPDTSDSFYGKIQNFGNRALPLSGYADGIAVVA